MTCGHGFDVGDRLVIDKLSMVRAIGDGIFHSLAVNVDRYDFTTMSRQQAAGDLSDQAGANHGNSLTKSWLCQTDSMEGDRCNGRD